MRDAAIPTRAATTPVPGLAGGRLIILAASDLPTGKPDRRAFLAARTASGAPPGGALTTGDNPATDIAGGLAAGLQACHLGRHGESPAGEPRVSSLAEIEF